MVRPNGNHEYKDNKRNIDIPSTTSAIERKMLEYMATQFLLTAHQHAKNYLNVVLQTLSTVVALLEDWGGGLRCLHTPMHAYTHTHIFNPHSIQVFRVVFEPKF
jgi:hypothetical protein